MTRQSIISIVACSACMLAVGLTLAAQGRFTVTSPNGIAFAEFKGYDTWPVIAPSRTDEVIKTIVGNPPMIKAYLDGFPGNGTPIPDGAVMAKMIWSSKTSTLLPGSGMVPDTLRKVQFMVKDAKRFPDTDGWGYADFIYDAATSTFKGAGNGPAFAKAACHQCHTRVQARDFVFTEYAPR